MFKPKIESNLVHHIILYQCSNLDDHEGYFSCFNAPRSCTFMAGWAPGVDKQVLPKEAGFRVGNPSSNNDKFVLQIHYNNPHHLQNATDSSGLEMYYTSHFRKYDAGIMTLGSVKFEIPPGKYKYEVAMACNSFCTNKQHGPIYAFSTIHHAHCLYYNLHF